MMLQNDRVSWRDIWHISCSTVNAFGGYENTYMSISYQSECKMLRSCICCSAALMPEPLGMARS